MDNNQDSQVFLQNWTTSTIPDMIALTLYCVVGFVGNMIVLAVYKYKMQHTSQERYFIPVLATTDLLTSTVCSSLSLFHNMTPGYLQSSLVCSSMYFIYGSLATLSFSILFCIAVERYLKVCTQFRLSLNMKRIMIILSVFLSVAINLPYVFTMGIVELKKDNITVTFCTTHKTHHSIAFLIALMSLLSLMFLSFTFIYSRIIFKLFCHLNSFKRQKQRYALLPEDGLKGGLSRTEHQNAQQVANVYNNPMNIRCAKKVSDTSSSETISSEHLQENLSKICSGHGSYNSRRKNTIQENSRDYIVENRGENSVVGSNAGRNKQTYSTDHTMHGEYISKNTVQGNSNKNGTVNVTWKTSKISSRVLYTKGNVNHNSMIFTTNDTQHLLRKNKKTKNKLVIMFMVITVVCGFCYIPVTILMIYGGLYPDLWIRIPQKYMPILLLSWHIYIVNNIINPFIYAFMDRKFQIALKRLFTRFSLFTDSGDE